MLNNIKITLILSILCLQVNSQTTKGLYINDFIDIIDNESAENELLLHAQSNGYNYLILYNLYAIHNSLFDITNPLTSLPLANFIEKARTTYGITQVAAVGETYNSFNNIHDYNLDHSANPNQQFDHYNIEFEFWNESLVEAGGYYCNTYLDPMGLSCDTTGSFSFLIDNLCDLKTLTDGFANIDAEMYIGWPNAGQAKQIADCTDRVLVHYYRSSDVYMSGNSIYNYGVGRLPDLAASSSTSVVMPIFNCRSSFMGPWLDTNPADQAFDTWMNGLNGYNDATGTWKSNTTVDGHVWYRYSCMPATALPIELVYFSGRSNQYNNNVLYWQINHNTELLQMDIERADTKGVFHSIQSIQQPYGINSSYTDKNFKTNNNQYRLKFTFIDNSIEYSKIISIKNTQKNISAQWNAHNKQLNISNNTLKHQSIHLYIYGISGRHIDTQTLNLATGEHPINLAYLKQGSYIVQLQNQQQYYNIKIQVL